MANVTWSGVKYMVRISSDVGSGGGVVFWRHGDVVMVSAIGVGRGAEVLWLDEMELWSTVHQSQHRSQRGWSSSIESYNLSKNLISRMCVFVGGSVFYSATAKMEN
ncbi:hypothetical protein DY000_02003954 [Brassica cretica]|uniref:F-box associated domain-containing protein n=1 Tax=Brassica cretica TaxID=69181 RepID=A0ABQ7BV10_BRACR|nr:hypothetical protein DY000_02003954 [Brassica cretica]